MAICHFRQHFHAQPRSLQHGPLISVAAAIASTALPRVAIVITTYNLSNVLLHAIESVRRSSLADWELLVVGDACTDDSAEVVAGFKDARIRFLDLEHNFGEQSDPNNVGSAQVRAPVRALLNHDDLYFPDHLALCLAQLETSGADLVFSGLAAAEPRSPDHYRLALKTELIPYRFHHENGSALDGIDT